MTKPFKFIAPNFRWPGSRLVYLHDAALISSSRRVVVRCDCGVVKSVIFRDLQSGRTLSCGCLKSEQTTSANIVRGEGRISHWLYSRWHSMHPRCYNLGDPYYHCYGQKGVIICPEWFDFTAYCYWIEVLQSMLPSDTFEVHRKDSDGPYHPMNCVCLHPVEHRKQDLLLRKLKNGTD